MQIALTDHAQHSIAHAAEALSLKLAAEGEYYPPIAIESILVRCLECVAEDWAADVLENVTRPRPYGLSQTEFLRLLKQYDAQRTA